MNNKLVSVIMSVYNENIKYLEDSISSILNQSYNNIEFIIVLDNPENKEAEEFIANCTKIDKRIILIKNNANKGLTNSLNKALKIARGEYICRMDADDISYINRIKCQVDYIEKQNIDILGGGKEDINENGDIVNKFTNVIQGYNKVKKILAISNIVYHPTWMVRASVYKNLNGYNNIDTAEDYDFLLRAVEKGYKVDNINKCILKYRLTTNSISRSNSLKQFLTSECLKKNYKKNYKKLDIEEYVTNRMNKKNIYKYDLGNRYIQEIFYFIKHKKYIISVKKLVELVFKGSKYNIKNIIRIIKYKLYSKVL